ncbi:MAG: aspartate--ammonia ligase [Eubacteriaceae bacterium]|nr:aspartate--ammonia ligase [Eubacteriaceae bacterium]MBR2780024.1 aspartate--ammonia ligase [Eubacteriaceae bacterium]MCR4893176.1 aspartate--ammonia ligase [Eubacteriales bacterium]
MTTVIPEGYTSALDLYDTQSAIALIKSTFQGTLESILTLKRISAPLFVDPNTGINDNLNGTERAVRFDVPYTGKDAEVVHSLAKWKRYALYRYHFFEGRGLYTDMNAIRRDEELDNLHSVYVDQWDWERVITRAERTEEYLENTVRQIVKCICFTGEVVKAKYPYINQPELNLDVKFITSQELLERYPDLDSAGREYAICREYGTVFVKQIGYPLSNGLPHDSRSPDYDDWKLNGDLLFYYPLLDCVIEISSMGIRVDADSLDLQLTKAGCDDRRNLMYHRMVFDGTLPLTIGGGIGQSRLCMLLMGKAHIGEVQASIWDEETISKCEAAGIKLL